MRSMEVSPAPAVASDGASLQSMMSPNEQDAETKAKIRRYIVENSDLRLQLQRERQQHEESLKGKELEYEQSKVTLQEEFSKKLAENRELRGAMEEKRDIPEGNDSKTRDGAMMAGWLMDRRLRRKRKSLENGKSDLMGFRRRAMN